MPTKEFNQIFRKVGKHERRTNFNRGKRCNKIYSEYGRNNLIQLVKTSKNAPVLYTGGKYFFIKNELADWVSKSRGFYKK